MYLLERSQRLAAPLERVWAFLRHPANLDRITPPDLRFRIVSELPRVMYNGLVVEYRITIPLLGTHAWVTEIKHIRELHSFVDEQRLGPYRFWYHYHQLEQQGDEVVMLDRVHYQPPLGLLGSLLHDLYIRRTLERIFSYRREQLHQLLDQGAGEEKGAGLGQ
ncbi:SRPBCC family protein [Desulfogranum mediterraneum]|uniref:SRPBCC family protein n=1 Tax=Desulfogranum mediterraneum TaxID=160661 RepID=UPI000428F289|nr:SRPBCC family protein [Desulfogranum mediterraneum]